MIMVSEDELKKQESPVELRAEESQRKVEFREGRQDSGSGIGISSSAFCLLSEVLLVYRTSHDPMLCLRKSRDVSNVGFGR